ncbi:mitogen-activated protein kinase kinase kinase 20-like [Salvia miltiorrhiza]|uniref:mitogen-activated protein kinase kinase kinase 20-like n=1 Tax=Salvia miltiorrhiza TaxID=226208 RepID=UPI0025ABEFF6|nr:mitogen-activated protein kinase kinase kinase 20-like [Salvia miltiorrhiza]
MKMHWTRGETLGAGGFGFVSIAKTHQEGGGNPNIPAVVAVKSAIVSQSKSLQKEKELLKKLEGCPCILRCFTDQFTTENCQNLYNIILEYAPGGCLADLIGKGLPEHVVSRHTKSLVTALIHIHKHGYVHCDVKPHNVLLVGHDSKLADFGSCKRIGSVEDDDDEQQQGFRGTVLYAAPESISRQEYTAASDVWALGCTVLHMLTGKAPWKFGKDAAATDVLMKIGCSNEIPAIPKVSEEAKDFLRKCFVKDPTARWKAESLLDHPFLKMADGRRRRRHLSSALHSLLPQCFHVTKIHAY